MAAPSKHGLNLRIRGDADLAAVEEVRQATHHKTRTKAIMVAVYSYVGHRMAIAKLKAENAELRCRLAALAARHRAAADAAAELQAALDAEANRQ